MTDTALPVPTPAPAPAPAAAALRSTRERVVVLDHCALLSGAEIAISRLLPALERYEPHVILADDGPLVQRLRDLDVSVEVVAMDDSARDLGRERVGRGLPIDTVRASFSYVRLLVSRVRSLRPVALHANSLKAGYYGSAVSVLTGIPLVWHVRDRISDDYLPGAAVTLTRAISGARPVAIVTPSQSVMDTLGRPLRRQLRTVVADPYQRSAPISRRGDSARPVVGMVGRISEWKGQDVFLRALAELRRRGVEVTGAIIGKAMFGEDQYERQLHQLAEELQITDLVEFRGFCPDIEAELDSLDVLVHASRIPEPFGQVVVEGMASGRAVVAAAAGGPLEVIDNERTGLLFTPGDHIALADQLQKLATDAPLRHRLADAGRAAADNYLPAPIAREIESVYDRVQRRGR